MCAASGQRHNDRCGPVAVAHIVLEPQYRARSALLMPITGSTRPHNHSRKTLPSIRNPLDRRFQFLHRARSSGHWPRKPRKFRFKSLQFQPIEELLTVAANQTRWILLKTASRLDRHAPHRLEGELDEHNGLCGEDLRAWNKFALPAPGVFNALATPFNSSLSILHIENMTVTYGNRLIDIACSSMRVVAELSKSETKKPQPLAGCGSLFFFGLAASYMSFTAFRRRPSVCASAKGDSAWEGLGFDLADAFAVTWKLWRLLPGCARSRLRGQALLMTRSSRG